MGYPLNAEGLVGDESAPSEPPADALAASGSLEVDDAGVEAAPALSNEALDAVDRLAERMKKEREDPG